MQLLFFDLVPIEDPSLVVSPQIGAGPRLESGGTISAVVDFLGDKLLLRSSSLTFSAPLCAFRSCVRRVNRDVANDVSHRLSRSKASGVAMAMIDDLVRLDRQGQKVRARPIRDEGRLEARACGRFRHRRRPGDARPSRGGRRDHARSDNGGGARSRCGPRVDQSFAADEDYHSPQSLKKLDGGPSKARIAWPKPAKGYLPWHDGDASQSVNSPSSSGAVAPAS